MTFKQHQKFLLTYQKYYQIVKDTQLTKSFYKRTFAFQTPVFLNSCRGRNTSALFVKTMILTNQAYNPKCNYKSNIISQNFRQVASTNKMQINILAKRQRFITNSLKGILLVNFPEKEKNFLIKNLAAENKIALITQSASLLLKDSRNMDDLLGVDDPIQILFDRVKTCLPCICFINNLDRIGKQRYEQEHKSLYPLDTSILSLISGNLSHDPVLKTTNEKEKLDLPISTRSSFQFKNRKAITPTQGKKNCQIIPLSFSASRFFHPYSDQNREYFSFSLTHRLIPITPPKRQSVLSSLPKRNPSKKPVLEFLSALAGQKINHGYYHRFPFWLSQNESFPKFKVDTSQIKLFDFFARRGGKKNRFTSRQVEVNPWLLQMIYSKRVGPRLINQTGAPQLSLNPSRFKKTESNRVDLKTEFDFHLDGKKTGYSSITPYVMQSNSTSPLQNFQTRLNGQKQPNTFRAKKNSFGDASFMDDMKNKRFASIFPKNFETGLKNKPVMRKFVSGGEINNPPLRGLFPDVEKESTKNNSARPRTCRKITETEIIKRTALLKFLQILDGFHTTTENKKWISFPYLSMFLPGKILKNQRGPARAREKNTFQFKTGFETEWSKWLKKFIIPNQILSSSATLGVSYYKGLSIKKTKKAMGPFATRRNPEKIKPKPLAGEESIPARIHDKSFLWAYTKLPTKNFRIPLPKKNLHNIILNRIQNTKGFSKIMNSVRPELRKKIKETQKSSTVGTAMTYKLLRRRGLETKSPQRRSHASIKKTFQRVSFIKTVPKWELYLKNQPVLKSLNLLCVWPSYIEDMVGLRPYGDLNDGASYILPEYFQLLGHGPKLKKQGITLLASTNNLKTLDAALLRPGRFDTIINFANQRNSNSSFSFMYKRDSIIKHSFRVTQNQVFSVCKSSIRERECVDLPTWSLRRDKSFKNWPRFSGTVKPKEKNYVPAKVFLGSPVSFMKRGPTEKNTDFLCNNTILMPSVPLINMYKTPTRADQFDAQVTVLDIPTQSIPIKTFIDVSILIQYKLWWSFKNEKLSWFPLRISIPFLSAPAGQKRNPTLFLDPRGGGNKADKTNGRFDLNQTGFIQKTKTGLSNYQKFKPTKGEKPINVQLILQSKTYTDLIRAFMTVFRVICLRIYTMFQVPPLVLRVSSGLEGGTQINPPWRSFNPKIIVDSAFRNQTKPPAPQLLSLAKASAPMANKNPTGVDLVNSLGWEILISKAVADFDFDLPPAKAESKSKINRSTYSNTKDKFSASPLSEEVINNTNALHFLENSATKELPKNYSSLYNSLNQYCESKKQVSTLYNYKNQSVQQSTSSNCQMEPDYMFLKFYRGLLFCIGDFNDKTYSEKNPSRSSGTFIRRVRSRAKNFFSPNQNNQTKNITQPKTTDFVKSKTVSDLYLNKKKEKKSAFGEFESSYSIQSTDVTTAFLDWSSKTWKDSGKVRVVKNNNQNDVMLTKYNEIYKLKKIKCKQQSFFNLHPFTQFMLKRWPKITKPNKLKRHSQVSLASVFFGLENTDPFQFLTQFGARQNKNQTWPGRILKKNTDQLEANSVPAGKPFRRNFIYRDGADNSLVTEDPQNFSINPNWWFSNFDLGSIYTQIYHDLYQAVLIMPNCKKESLKTLGFHSIASPQVNETVSPTIRKLPQAEPETNNFLSTNPSFSLDSEGNSESYLFRKLTRHCSLNIMCIQVNPSFPRRGGFQANSLSILSSLEQKKPEWKLKTESNFKKSIHSSGLENQAHHVLSFHRDEDKARWSRDIIDDNVFWTKKSIIDPAFSYTSSITKNELSCVDFLQTENHFAEMGRKKIARKTIINDTNNDFQNYLQFKRFSAKTNQPELNNIVLLKNFVSSSACPFTDLRSLGWNPSEKKEHNASACGTTLNTHQSSFQNLCGSKSAGISHTEPEISSQIYTEKTRETKLWGGTQLDTSFFLLIFYTMFFEKISAAPHVPEKKITLNTIKIFMPYKSVIFSHFLLSQGKISGFSCKNFEILVYNKFKNFLMDF